MVVKFFKCKIFFISGTTKLKMTSTPSVESANGPNGGVQSEFVERRRAALERFLNRVAQHPVLSIDPDFRQFLESGQFYHLFI